jgi:hypothetical protein
MATTITVRMYSGVPDPTWELTHKQERDLDSLLKQSRKLTLQQSSAALGRLGYRGFEISSTNQNDIPAKSLVFDGIVDIGESDDINFVDGNSDIELFLLRTAGPSLLQEDVDYIQQEITKNSAGGVAGSTSSVKLLAVPPFNPNKWNNDPNVKRRNNCYNYANDKITNTFAQPGRGSGQVGPYPPTCSATGAAAQRDGQVSVPAAASTPGSGHYVALVIWPGRDYHWYRLDNNAQWSHKPGQTAARNTDNNGHLITDPKSCDRGPYSQWCGYYHCDPGNTRII